MLYIVYGLDEYLSVGSIIYNDEAMTSVFVGWGDVGESNGFVEHSFYKYARISSTGVILEINNC